MATTNSWSSATISKLKTLFERGMSTAEIGKRLGFTKNAVVGKINRLKLNFGKSAKSAKPKAKVAAKKPAAKKPASKAPVKVPAKKSSAPAPKSFGRKAAGPAARAKDLKASKDSKLKTERIIQHSAALMALRADQCRWPVGDPDSGDFRFCGEKCFVGKPYCFEHCKVAYQFTQPAKKR